MQIEKEANRFRITLNVEEALALQGDLSRDILRAVQFRQQSTAAMPIVHKVRGEPHPSRSSRADHFPSALLITIEPSAKVEPTMASDDEVLKALARQLRQYVEERRGDVEECWALIADAFWGRK